MFNWSYIILLNYYFAKNNIKPKMWGIDISKYDLLKTFALVLSSLRMFILLNVVYYLFHVDIDLVY